MSYFVYLILKQINTTLWKVEGFFAKILSWIINEKARVKNDPEKRTKMFPFFTKMKMKFHSSFHGISGIFHLSKDWLVLWPFLHFPNNLLYGFLVKKCENLLIKLKWTHFICCQWKTFWSHLKTQSTFFRINLNF